jgi:hypothetical protein
VGCLKRAPAGAVARPHRGLEPVSTKVRASSRSVTGCRWRRSWRLVSQCSQSPTGVARPTRGTTPGRRTSWPTRPRPVHHAPTALLYDESASAEEMIGQDPLPRCFLPWTGFHLTLLLRAEPWPRPNGRLQSSKPRWRLKTPTTDRSSELGPHESGYAFTRIGFAPLPGPPRLLLDSTERPAVPAHEKLGAGPDGPCDGEPVN